VNKENIQGQKEFSVRTNIFREDILEEVDVYVCDILWIQQVDSLQH
jgi:hypothetical protein